MNDLERHTLQEWRQIRNMSQIDLAFATRQLDPQGKGLTNTTISDWERAEYPPKTENALLIARALGDENGPLLLDQILWPALEGGAPVSWRKSTAAAADPSTDPKARAA